MYRFLYKQCAIIYILVYTLLACNITNASPMPEYMTFSTKQYFFWEGAYRPAIVLWLTPDKGFYLYAHSEVSSGKPTNISVMRGNTPLDGVDILYPVGTTIRDIQDPSKSVAVYQNATPFVIILPQKTILEKLNIRADGLLCTIGKCIPVRAIANIVVEDPEALTDVRKEKWFRELNPALAMLMGLNPDRSNAIASSPPKKKKLVPMEKVEAPIVQPAPQKKTALAEKKTEATKVISKKEVPKKTPTLPKYIPIKKTTAPKNVQKKGPNVIWYDSTPTPDYTKPRQSVQQPVPSYTKVIPKPNVVWHREPVPQPTQHQRPKQNNTAPIFPNPEGIRGYIPPSVVIRQTEKEVIYTVRHAQNTVTSIPKDKQKIQISKNNTASLPKKSSNTTTATTATTASNTTNATNATTASNTQNIIAPKPVDNKNVVNRLWNFTPRIVQNSLEVGSLTKALVFAFLAGFILNFMPCVFPILTLKFSSFIAFATRREEEEEEILEEYGLNTEYDEYTALLDDTNYDDTIATPSMYSSTLSSFRKYNFFFCLGIITFFGILGVFLHLTGSIWGRLFQIPEVMLAMACIVFMLALSIFEVFTLPIFSMKASNNTSSAPQAFLTGILTTLLATPCSAPLLGGVLAWLISQSMQYYIIVLVVLALGMSLPYILFMIFPSVLFLLPKPGKWNMIIAQIVGFFLVATTIYLLSLLPLGWLLSSLITLFILTVMLWIWGTFTGFEYTTLRTWIIRLFTSSIAIASIYWVLLPSPPSLWTPFSPLSFTKVLGKELLVVNFTADWCPNCKILEKTVLTPKNIARWKQQYNATFIVADITRENLLLQKLMELLHSNSIPLLAIFPKGKMVRSPLLLRDIYTTRQVDSALKEASK